MKATKLKANYHLGSGSKLCGKCLYYSSHKCSKVSGSINPKYVCKYWRGK